MKLLCGHVLVLIVGALVAIHMDRPRQREENRSIPSASADAPQWRRTANGWELMSTWAPERPRYQPWGNVTAIHPATFAGLQLLASLGALVAFSPDPAARNPDTNVA